MTKKVPVYGMTDHSLVLEGGNENFEEEMRFLKE
jgi:hypothetical protein